MSTPRATVRLQLHEGFTFDDAAATVDYYAKLGISHFYVSPVFAARAGSTHGYDVIDPTRINPELGGEAGLLRLVEALRGADMGLVIDIVPNHMGVASSANRYWQDVLQWGRSSRYAQWFDINWEAPEPHLHGRLLLPVLGEPYDRVLRSGQLTLHLDAESGQLWLACYDNRLPLAPQSYSTVLAGMPIANAFSKISAKTIEQACQDLASLYASDDGKRSVDAALARLDPGNAAGQAALHEVLQQQHYRLSWWRNAAEEINWRRFFEVSDLAGVRVELDDVFEATHALVFQLYGRGVIDGVRVDHVDGLADPRAYCRKLRGRLNGLGSQRPAALGKNQPWIVIEKILSPGETVPLDWQVDGTTGYEFMDQVGAVLHSSDGEKVLRQLWADLIGDTAGFEAHVQAAREQLLAENFVGELEALSRSLYRYAESAPRGGHDYALPAIRRVLRALLASFRRYRTYTTDSGASAVDKDVLQTACDDARRLLHAPDHPLLDVVTDWLGLADTDAQGSKLQLRQEAITRFQQLTPPLAAKSMEDTAFYRYAPLLSRNEVGSYPGEPAAGVAAFHAANLERANSFPHSLLATATHDHKRGEDARARLAVLSEIPVRWGQCVKRWMQAHAALRATLPRAGGGLIPAPAAADEWMLYQTLVGAWPPGLDPQDQEAIDGFTQRVAAWQEKSLREGKRHSSWMLPQTDYESACRSFLEGLMRDHGFVAEMSALVTEIEPAAAANVMTQTLLRLTSPGIPDLYQGTEFEDFSLVDPDNRRPVDMDARREALMQHGKAVLPIGANPDRPFRQKQQLIRRALESRQHHPEVFCGGDYLPLEVLGRYSEHVIAFARRNGTVFAVTVALRHPARLLETCASATIEWSDASITLPPGFPRNWKDVLSDTDLDIGEGALRLADVLHDAPTALLVAP